MQDGMFGGGNFGGGYGQTQQQQATQQAPQSQSVQPEVVYRHPAPRTEYLPFLPDLATVTGKVDSVARRIPWWMWVGGTVAFMIWLQRRGTKGRAFRISGE